MAHEATQFRTAGVPSSTTIDTALLHITPAERVRVEGGRFHFWLQAATVAPPELYLRDALTLDADDPEALIAFATSCGLPVLSPVSLAPIVGDIHFRAVKSVLEPAMRGALPAEPGDGPASRYEWHPSDDPSADTVSYPLSVVQTGARLCRALAAHYVAIAEGVDPVPAWRFLNQRIDAELAWATWAFLSSELLKPFHPVLDVNVAGKYRVAWRAGPDLPNVVAAQVFNAVVEHAEVRTCPLCGTRFTKQEGRAVYGQNRTKTVTYCTSRCARLKADRDYRARKRAEKGGAR